MLLMFAVSSPHFVTRARTSTSHLVAPGSLICPFDMTKGPTLTDSVKLRRSHSWIEERKRKRQPLCQFRSNSGGVARATHQSPPLHRKRACCTRESSLLCTACTHQRGGREPHSCTRALRSCTSRTIPTSCEKSVCVCVCVSR